MQIEVPDGVTTTELFTNQLPVAYPQLVPILETAALARNQARDLHGHTVPDTEPT